MAEIGREHKEKRDLKSDEYLSRFSKEDKIIPTVNLVLYYGKEEWNGSEDLHGMLDFGKKADVLKKYIPNYKINLICVNNVKNIEQYQTGLRELFGVLKNSDNKEKFKSYIKANQERFSNLDEVTFDVISKLTQMGKTALSKTRFKNAEGGMDMCKAIEEIRKEGREEGLEEGREEGLEEGREEGLEEGREEGLEEGREKGREEGEGKLVKLIQQLIIGGKMEEVKKCTEDSEYRKKLYMEYGIN